MSDNNIHVDHVEKPDSSGTRNTTPLWLPVGCVSLATLATEMVLHFELKSLERGEVNSITVSGFIADLYNLFGYWGAMSVIPGIGAVAILQQVVSRFPAQGRVVVVGLLAATGVMLLGVAGWMFHIPISEGRGPFANPVSLVLCVFIGLLGCGSLALTWRASRNNTEP